MLVILIMRVILYLTISIWCSQGSLYAFIFVGVIWKVNNSNTDTLPGKQYSNGGKLVSDHHVLAGAIVFHFLYI